ncbi:NADPH-dependent curcumin reductase [Exophiala dermatitidis]
MSWSRSNLEIIFASPPENVIIPDQTFKQRIVSTPSASDLQAGQLLVETLYVSLDRVLRKWLSVPNNFLGFKVGHGKLNPTIARVVASKSPEHQPGDPVSGWVGWVNHAVVMARTIDKVDVPEGAKVSDALGLFGHTGLSAYAGLLRIGRPKSGEPVLVSAAAGAVGSVAVQIAKIQGARVVGIARGKGKCRFLREALGLDVALDYKASEFEPEFAQALGETGLDVSFDNVGGKVLQMAFERANSHRHLRNKFSVFDYTSEAAAARADLLKWLHEGRLRRAETVLHGGLELAPTALVELLAGKNVGKMVLEVKAE